MSIPSLVFRGVGSLLCSAPQELARSKLKGLSQRVRRPFVAASPIEITRVVPVPKGMGPKLVVVGCACVFFVQKWAPPWVTQPFQEDRVHTFGEQVETLQDVVRSGKNEVETSQHVVEELGGVVLRAGRVPEAVEACREAIKAAYQEESWQEIKTNILAIEKEMKHLDNLCTSEAILSAEQKNRESLERLQKAEEDLAAVEKELSELFTENPALAELFSQNSEEDNG